MVRVYCKNTGTYAEFAEGTTLMEMAQAFDFLKPYPVLTAKVNFIPEGLKYKVFSNSDNEFLDYRTYAGRSAYCRSLNFLLCKAVSDLFPGSRIKLRRPISKGCWCDLDKQNGSSVSSDDIAAIKARMAELVRQDIPFIRHEARIGEVVEMFARQGYDDKVRLLETQDRIYVTFYTLDGTPDYFYDVLLPSTGLLKVWDLQPSNGSFILRVPDRHDPAKLAPYAEQPKTFEVFKENMRWNEIMHLDNVGDVNKACAEGGATDLIQVSEALQENKIVKMAEAIYRRYNDKDNPLKVVLITGPSSSGKSTVCRKLSVQLLACGLQPVSFSTDDYFVNRVETPLLPDGSYDFDNFETVDHKALEKDVLKLLSGEEVEVPQYNFVTGIREYNGRKLKLSDGKILLIEGIHALNPELIPHVPDSAKYKVFISTLTSISLDDHNCILTSDNRLLRRIMRDSKMGSFTPQETIRQWPNVRRSEVQWIYPYQETADVLFNSAYLVEFAVIRPYAEKVLRTVPRNCPEYADAYRLLRLLEYFNPVSDRDVPPTSLIRSFL